MVEAEDRGGGRMRLGKFEDRDYFAKFRTSGKNFGTKVRGLRLGLVPFSILRLVKGRERCLKY